MQLHPFFLLKYLFRSASTYWALFHAKIDLQTPYIYIYRKSVFRLFHSTVLETFRKNKETILSSLQACFVITNSSGDFIVKNICTHCLYTLHICITGIAVNSNALFNCYVKCGYQYTLHYEPLTTNNRKNRQRNHTLVQPLIQQKYLSAPILDTDSLP